MFRNGHNDMIFVLLFSACTILIKIKKL